MVPFLSGGLLQFIPLFIGLLLILIVMTFILNLLSGLRRWHENNKQPVKTVVAKVVSKRAEVKNNAPQNNELDQEPSATYFATFEDEEGHLLELKVNGRDYDLMADDESGELTYQGTRFKGFKRRLRSYSS